MIVLGKTAPPGACPLELLEQTLDLPAQRVDRQSVPAWEIGGDQQQVPLGGAGGDQAQQHAIYANLTVLDAIFPARDRGEQGPRLEAFELAQPIDQGVLLEPDAHLESLLA